jgi:hypothetical protein
LAWAAGSYRTSPAAPLRASHLKAISLRALHRCPKIRNGRVASAARPHPASVGVEPSALTPACQETTTALARRGQGEGLRRLRVRVTSSLHVCGGPLRTRGAGFRRCRLPAAHSSVLAIVVLLPVLTPGPICGLLDQHADGGLVQSRRAGDLGQRRVVLIDHLVGGIGEFATVGRGEAGLDRRPGTGGVDSAIAAHAVNSSSAASTSCAAQRRQT